MPHIILFFLELLILYFLSRKVIKIVFLVIHKLTRKQKPTIYIFWFLFLPGTILHELSHLVMATVLFVPAGKLSLFPEQTEEGRVKLGSVGIAKTDPIRKTLIAIAPIIFGLTLLFLLLYSTSHNYLINDWRGALFIGYVVFEIGNTMFSSREDLRGLWQFFVIFLGLLAIGYFTGIRVSVNENREIAEQFFELLRNLNIFLLVPLALDAVIIGLFNLLLPDK